MFIIFADSNFVLGNAQSSGYPVVYCSDGFCDLTGFPRAQVMGKRCACKFLYGSNTSDMEKDKIKNALDCVEELKTEIVLYKRNSQYLCFFISSTSSLSAIYDSTYVRKDNSSVSDILNCF